MKAMVKTAEAPGCLAWREWPDPVPQPGQALVEILRAGICSTDVQIHDWSYRPRRPVLVPSVLGHEAAGVVTAVNGRLDGIEVGDRVALQVIWGHAQAAESLLGHENLDPDWYHLGASALGGVFAERIAVDAARLVRLPPQVTVEDGAMLEPAAVAAHAMELVRLAPGERACLVGPGPFGLLMCQIARSAGAGRIAAVGLAGVDEARLDVALRHAGVDEAIAHGDDVAATAEEAAARLGGRADVVLDCGGTPDSLQIALEVAGPGARVAVFGFAPRSEIEPLRHLVRKGLVLAGVSAAARRHYGSALRMIAGGLLRPAAIVSHTLPMSEAEAGIGLVSSRVASKVALVPVQAAGAGGT